VSTIREQPVHHYLEVFGLGAEGQGFVVEVDFKLTFGFLVVEMEDCRHRFCSAELLVPSLEVFTLTLPCPCSGPLPLPTNLHQHEWLLGRQHMYTFWRWCLAGQRCRCWRKGAPGQIPVGHRYWGVITCSFCHFRWCGWSCDCQQPPWSRGPCVYRAAIAAACRWGHGAIQYRRLLWGRQTQLRLLFSWKAILDVLCQQGDLVSGSLPVSKPCLLL